MKIMETFVHGYTSGYAKLVLLDLALYDVAVMFKMVELNGADPRVMFVNVGLVIS